MKTSIYNYFTETAQCFPGKTAVIEGDQLLIFGQLQQATYALASELL